jgi:TatA/E family protein of Tat protein translocase
MIILPPLLFLAGSPGPLELLVVFAAVLVLFGPRKLPEIARFLGRMLGELRKASEEFRSQVMSLDLDDGGKKAPFKSPDADGVLDDTAEAVQDPSRDPYDCCEPRSPDVTGESISTQSGEDEPSEEVHDDDDRN